VLLRVQAGALIRPDGQPVETLELAAEVQLPGGAFQPAFTVSSVEPIRFSFPTTITAGESWRLVVGSGLPGSEVSVDLNGLLLRTFALDQSGRGSTSIALFSGPTIDVGITLISTSGRDVRRLLDTVTVTPAQLSDVRATADPIYETFQLRPYTITIPTGVVYTDEIVEAILEGGSPGATATVVGPYLAGDNATFDATGRAVIRFRAAEISPGFPVVVGVNIFLPDRVGFQVIGAFIGAVRPVVATTTPTTVGPSTMAPTTIAPTTIAPTTAAPTTTAPTTVAVTTVVVTTLPVGTLSLSAPDRVAVGEAFQARATGLRPGAIVAITAGSNELGWAIANSSGVAAVTSSIWQRGSLTLTVNEIVDGVTVVHSASQPIQVGAPVISTLPEVAGFTIAAPASVSVGQTFAVAVTGLDVDSIIEVQAGDVTLGWALTDANGTATVSSSLWVSGSFPLTVTEWRYGTKLGTQTAPLSVN
jgi:hypothetical protein